jgi:hypothetical protein
MILGIDPHLKFCEIAIFEENKLVNIINEKTDLFIYAPNLRKPEIAVIETMHIGKNPKTALDLQFIAGKVAGSLIALFNTKIVQAPTFGHRSWIRDMFGPKIKREDLKRLSLIKAKALWPNYEFQSDHESDAALICQWYFDNKLRYGL